MLPFIHLFDWFCRCKNYSELQEREEVETLTDASK